MNLSPLQKTVLEQARRQIENEPWYRGVSLDEFKTMDDAEIRAIGVPAAVESVVLDTAAWDDWPIKDRPME